MTQDELRQYIEATRAAHGLPFFVERLFRTNEEWDRVSASELRNISLSSKTEATLDDVLAHRSVAVLGEPGSGKSTVARSAVEKVVARGWVPLVGRLRSYTGDLSGLLAEAAPEALISGEPIDGVRAIRVLILDGVDEIRYEQLDRFVTELTAFTERDSTLRVFLTSRQAFYDTNRERFTNPLEAFYLLDFNERNVREYLEHYGGRYDAFMEEVNRVEVAQEIGNPFALQVLFEAFHAGQSLGHLRYQAVERVVESLIASRPDITADRQRRALRMLAVAMERRVASASRNSHSGPPRGRDTSSAHCADLDVP